MCRGVRFPQWWMLLVAILAILNFQHFNFLLVYTVVFALVNVDIFFLWLSQDVPFLTGFYQVIA